MINLQKTIVFCAAIGLATVAFGETTMNKNLASNGGAVMAGTAQVGQPAVQPAHKTVVKHQAVKVVHHNGKVAVIKIDITALNSATEKEIAKAVKVKKAKKIIAAKLAAGGKFTDEQQLFHDVKLTKAQKKKLAEFFPVKEEKK